MMRKISVLALLVLASLAGAVTLNPLSQTIVFPAGGSFQAYYSLIDATAVTTIDSSPYAWVKVTPSTTSTNVLLTANVSIPAGWPDGQVYEVITAYTNPPTNVAYSYLYIIVDSTPPTISGFSPTTSYLTRPLLSASITDANGVNPNSVRVYVDGLLIASSFQDGAVTATPPWDLTLGAHVVRIKANDSITQSGITILSGGPNAASQDFAFNIQTPPVPVLNYSLPAFTNQTLYSFSGNASYVQKVVVTINGGPQAVFDASTGVFNATVNLAQGPNSVTVTATNSNATVALTRSVTLQSAPPSIAFLTPANATALDTLAIQSNVTDPVLLNANYSLDGGVWVPLATTSGVYSTSVVVLPLSIGSHNYSIQAIDAAGNTATNTTTFYSAPAIQIASATITKGTAQAGNTTDLLIFNFAAQIKGYQYFRFKINPGFTPVNPQILVGNTAYPVTTDYSLPSAYAGTLTSNVATVNFQLSFSVPANTPPGTYQLAYGIKELAN